MTSPHRPPPASSADPAEIARFAAMAADWWRPDGPMKALHRLNPVRIAWLRDRIAAHFPAPGGGMRDVEKPPVLARLKLLDIGCGAGILSEPMARLGAEVTGLDPAPGNVEMAQAHAEDAGLEISYRKQTAEELLEAGESFDVVCAMEVVEHVRDPARFIAAAAKL
ncbi:MAG: 3-demethylubiquinone-9 3-O-methyltransferase, partial [Alphaproteobacteria bacterium]|nr:3-demethylubiquinone-9 3-O-methyltransferase [Alphaproteobacteria bacterium]